MGSENYSDNPYELLLGIFFNSEEDMTDSLYVSFNGCNFKKIAAPYVDAYCDSNGNWYYYDIITGIMHHGWTTLPDGRTYYYDEITGIRQ